MECRFTPTYSFELSPQFWWPLDLSEECRLPCSLVASCTNISWESAVCLCFRSVSQDCGSAYSWEIDFSSEATLTLAFAGHIAVRRLWNSHWGVYFLHVAVCSAGGCPHWMCMVAGVPPILCLASQPSEVMEEGVLLTALPPFCTWIQSAIILISCSWSAGESRYLPVLLSLRRSPADVLCEQNLPALGNPGSTPFVILDKLICVRGKNNQTGLKCHLFGSIFHPLR